ncbi:MAG: hypothetical protein ABJE95_05100 [Byssovorax sp.]
MPNRPSTAGSGSRRICVQRFGGPRDMLRGAAWCLTGLALMGAITRVLLAGFSPGAMLLAIPFVLVSLGLVVIGSLCAVGAPLLWLSAKLARFRDGSLRVDDGLVLGEGGLETVLPLVSVTAAAMSLLDDELEIRTRDGDVIRAKVHGHEEGFAIVDALAASKVHGTWLASLHQRKPAARWVEWPWLTALAATLLGFLLAAPFVSLDLAAAIAGMLGGAARVLAAGAYRPGVVGSIVLGKDGIALKQAGKDRFVAFGAIESVAGTDAGASLTLTGGEIVAIDILPVPSPEKEPYGSLTARLAAARRARLLELLRDGMLPGGPEIVRAGALLERRGRTVRAWRLALSELVREASSGYRTAMLPKEQALAVLEDGHAPGELRIGAALALTVGGRAGEHALPRGLDADTALRLRVAVETCVNQDVRTALRDAIYGDLEEETLDRAMIAGRAAR